MQRHAVLCHCDHARRLENVGCLLARRRAASHLDPACLQAVAIGSIGIVGAAVVHHIIGGHALLRWEEGRDRVETLQVHRTHCRRRLLRGCAVLLRARVTPCAALRSRVRRRVHLDVFSVHLRRLLCLGVVGDGASRRDGRKGDTTYSWRRSAASTSGVAVAAALRRRGLHLRLKHP